MQGRSHVHLRFTGCTARIVPRNGGFYWLTPGVTLPQEPQDDCLDQQLAHYHYRNRRFPQVQTTTLRPRPITYVSVCTLNSKVMRFDHLCFTLCRQGKLGWGTRHLAQTWST